MCHLNVPLPMYLLCFVSVFEYYYFSFFKRFSFSIFSSEYSRTCVPTCWVEKSCNNVVGLFVCLLFAFILHFSNYLWHSPTVKLASHSTAHHFPHFQHIFDPHFSIYIFVKAWFKWPNLVKTLCDNEIFRLFEAFSLFSNYWDQNIR
jgi:hypothetical protein